MQWNTISGLLDGYRKRLFSPEEVVRAYLERIEALDVQYRSIITVTAESALRQAEAAGKLLAEGGGAPLLGVPVTHKDNIDTAGIRTTNGSRIDRDRVPERNATVVSRLDKAGCVTVGKANLFEYAFGITSDNPFYGTVRNPWDVRRTAGGSSSGSAASVAAGFCLGSIGTDTAGSIRVPAACCGVVGLKPTYGLLPMDGIDTLSWTLDHAGPIAGNVLDVALLLEAAAERPYADAVRDDIRGLRVGVPRAFVNRQVDPAVKALFEAALAELERLGASLVEIDLSFADEAVAVATGIATPEVGYAHRERIASSLELYGEGAAETFARSKAASAHAYMEAMRQRSDMTAKLDRLFETVDVIATPTMPAPPTLIGQRDICFADGAVESVDLCMIRFTCLYDITGHPAMSVPCGLTPDGLPIGLQLAAAHRAEATLIRTAYAYEQAALAGLYAEREARVFERSSAG